MDAATGSWAHEIGVSVEAFQRATIKTHNPVTVRKNVGDAYRGCLIVKVPKSSKLYWRVQGIMAGVARGQAGLTSPVDVT